ncbi:hypothetical protein T07_614, partial [Trichinella nelsoni]
LYYKIEFQVQMLLDSETFLEELYSRLRRSQSSFPFMPLSLKSQHTFWKVPRETPGYMSNKWPLKLPCAYLNTQGSSPSGTPLKRIDDGKVFDIIMRYSLKMPSFVQYSVVLCKSIFLHFRSISNKLKKVASIWVEMCMKSSIC